MKPSNPTFPIYDNQNTITLGGSIVNLVQIVADVFEHERDQSCGVGLRYANPTYTHCRARRSARRQDEEF